MPTTTPRPRPSGVEGWAASTRPRKNRPKPIDVVPLLQVGHERRAAGPSAPAGSRRGRRGRRRSSRRSRRCPTRISTSATTKRGVNSGPRSGSTNGLLGLRLGHAGLPSSTRGRRHRAIGVPHRSRATLVGMTRRPPDRAGARSPWRLATPVVGAAQRWRCSWSAPTAARAPTCGRAATPTSRRWSGTTRPGPPSSRSGSPTSTTQVDDAQRARSTTAGRSGYSRKAERAEGPGRPEPRSAGRASRSRSSDAPQSTGQDDAGHRRQPEPAAGAPAGHPGRASTRCGRAAPRRSRSRASGW